MVEGSKRVAVIDVGTNSSRLLVADVAGGRVAPVERRSTVTRLGRGRRPLRPALGRGDRGRPARRSASTSPSSRSWGPRRSTRSRPAPSATPRTASAFVAELRERFALSARVLDGEEEARLTYLGATSEHPPTEPTLVIDIGGGSTELIVGTGAEIAFHTSLQAGVVRHTERHIASDPPTAVELEALAADVRGLIEEAVGGRDRRRGGDRRRRHPDLARRGRDGAGALRPRPASTGTSSRCRAIQRMLSRLASAPLAERVEIPGLHPDRAPTIVAGVVILVEAMRAFGLERIEVSEHDILYGSGDRRRRSRA